MTQLALSDQLLSEPAVYEADPIIAPLVREQLEGLMGGPRDGGIGGPERALMRALLQDAVLCLVGQAAPANERKRLADDARYWVQSRSPEWVFSFTNVCEVLGIDPDSARQKLLEMADASGLGDASARNDKTLRGVRGLRRCGQRPRRAIHFMRGRRRRGGGVDVDSEA